MLDAEKVLFTAVADDLRSKYDGIVVYGEEVAVPDRYPCVTLIESSNVMDQRMMTGDGVEHFARVMYSVNVYSNLQTGGKQQCKDIMDEIDHVLTEHGLRRTMNQPTDNIQRTISRRTARFEGRLSEDGLMYRK